MPARSTSRRLRLLPLALLALLVLPAATFSAGGMNWAVQSVNAVGNNADGPAFLVKDIHPGEASSNLGQFVDVNGILFFVVKEAGVSLQLWKSDATANGTMLVKSFPILSEFAELSSFTNINGVLYFVAADAVHGREIWRSDGTPNGTVLVKDIKTGAESSNPYLLTNVNGTLFFTINDGEDGDELWKSDGSSGGTVLVKYFDDDFDRTGLTQLISFEGVLIFVIPRYSSAENTWVEQIWRSDGSANETTLVKEIADGFSIRELINANGTLFFIVDQTMQFASLWKSDGTAEGTVPLQTFGPISDQNLVDVSFLMYAGGNVYFNGYDPVHGTELWRTDGTTNGTTLFKEFKPGSGSSQSRAFTDINGTLFFGNTWDTSVGLS